MMHGVVGVGMASRLGMMLTLLVARRGVRSLTKSIPGLATWLITVVHLMKSIPGTTGSGDIVHGILMEMRLGGMHLARILRGVLVLLMAQVLLALGDCILDHLVRHALLHLALLAFTSVDRRNQSSRVDRRLSPAIIAAHVEERRPGHASNVFLLPGGKVVRSIIQHWTRTAG